jgi:hypothetical protein
MKYHQLFDYSGGKHLIRLDSGIFLWSGKISHL